VPQPLISVIIPTYNKGPLLVRTLQALSQQTVPPDDVEVLVIDDGSTDGTEAVVAGSSSDDRLRYVRQDNLGAGSARNHGAQLAQGDILVFLDADIVLDSDALAVHQDAHSQFDRSLMISRILPMTPNPHGLEDLLFQETMDFGGTDKVMTWRHAITQCLSIRREHFVEVGGFDTNLRRCQDIEFGYRAVQQGLLVRYLSQCHARHNHSMSLDERCRVERNNHRGYAALFRKHPGLTTELAHLRDKSDVNWHSDSLPLIVRKVARRTLATAYPRTVMRFAWVALNSTTGSERLKRWLYWKIVASYQLLGYQEGIRSLSSAEAAHPDQ